MSNKLPPERFPRRYAEIGQRIETPRSVVERQFSCRRFGALRRRADKRCASAATDTGTRRGRTAAEHRRHHGRRHRHVEHRRLPPRHDGRPDAEPRQDRRRRHAVHRLLRRGELHGGPRQLHHRRAADPHRHDHGRPGRRTHRHTGAGGDDRHRAQGNGLRHRPVRQEPSWRQERVSADGARLRRVLRLSLSPRRDGRSRRIPPIRRSC